MIAAAPDCLSAAELELLLSGDLPAEQFESSIAHLDQCPVCQRAADQVRQHADADNWFGDPGEDGSIDTACEVAILRLVGEGKPAPLPVEAQLLSEARALSEAVPLKTVGPYTLIGSIGQGGMGTVCLAEHRRLRRKCAIKFLPRHRAGDPGWLERFDREMTAVAALEHPHVVRATDAGHENGWHYLVMEYLSGLDVAAVASRLKRLPVAEACEVVRQAALGLSHVHDAGLVHRDIKPSNLMLYRHDLGQAG